MKNVMSDVSVITAAYNSEKTLADTIRSVIQQEFLPKEYIIVDDGSSDRTAEIVRAFIPQYPWIQLISTPNQGVAKARNTAWKASKGSLIAVLDDDDQYFPDALKNLYTGWLHGLETIPDLGMAYGNYQIFDEMHAENNFIVATPRAMPSGAPLLRQIVVMNMVLPSTSIYARSALESIGGWQEETGALIYEPQDLALMLYLAMRFNFMKIEHTICLYRQHSGQQNNNQAKLRYHQDLCRIDFILKYGPQIFFPKARTPEHLASELERLALKLVQRKRKKPIDTALLLLKISDGLSSTPQRKQNIQRFMADIPNLMNKHYPGGQRYQGQIDLVPFIARIKQLLNTSSEPR